MLASRFWGLCVGRFVKVAGRQELAHAQTTLKLILGLGMQSGIVSINVGLVFAENMVPGMFYNKGSGDIDSGLPHYPANQICIGLWFGRQGVAFLGSGRWA